MQRKNLFLLVSAGILGLAFYSRYKQKQKKDEEKRKDNERLQNEEQTKRKEEEEQKYMEYRKQKQIEEEIFKKKYVQEQLVKLSPFFIEIPFLDNCYNNKLIVIISKKFNQDQKNQYVEIVDIEQSKGFVLTINSQKVLQQLNAQTNQELIINIKSDKKDDEKNQTIEKIIIPSIFEQQAIIYHELQVQQNYNQYKNDLRKQIIDLSIDLSLNDHIQKVNIAALGFKGSGKSTFLNSLFSVLLNDFAIVSEAYHVLDDCTLDIKQIEYMNNRRLYFYDTPGIDNTIQKNQLTFTKLQEFLNGNLRLVNEKRIDYPQFYDKIQSVIIILPLSEVFEGEKLKINEYFFNLATKAKINPIIVLTKLDHFLKQSNDSTFKLDEVFIDKYEFLKNKALIAQEYLLKHVGLDVKEDQIYFLKGNLRLNKLDNQESFGDHFQEIQLLQILKASIEQAGRFISSYYQTQYQIVIVNEIKQKRYRLVNLIDKQQNDKISFYQLNKLIVQGLRDLEEKIFLYQQQNREFNYKIYLRNSNLPIMNTEGVLQQKQINDFGFFENFQNGKINYQYIKIEFNFS